MCISAARQAMPLGRAPHAQRSKAKRQRYRAARLRTPAPERIVRTQAIGKSQPEPPAATPARAPWLGTVVQVAGFVATVLAIFGSAFALNMSLRGLFSDSINTIKSEQAASITVLKDALTASSREQAASNRELAASITSLRSEQAASITSLKGDLTASSREQAPSNRELAASITSLKSEQAASITSLKGDLTASSREQAASNRELAASITSLKGDLTASSRELAASITSLKSEQAASNSVLNTKLDSINTKLDSNTASITELKSEVNAKLDSFSAIVQAQQIDTAKLQGLVSGLQEGGKKK